MATPENLWQRLVDEAGDDAVDSAAAVSVGQAERELVAAGSDMKAERERAEARMAEFTGGAGAPSQTPAPEPAMDPTSWVRGAPPPARRSPASRKVVWLTAALVAAATAGGIFYAAAHRPKPPDNPVEGPTATAPAPAPSPPVAPSEPLPRGEKLGLPRDSKPGLAPK